MITRPKYGKLWWSFLAAWALLVPACILSLRQRVMCPALELKAFDYLPLSGVVRGYDPHVLYRIMHNLTHPVPLLAYAAVLTYLATRPMVGPVSERFGRLLNYGLPSLHLAFFSSYLASMFLPIGDMISVLSR